MNKDTSLKLGTLLAILLFCSACSGLTSPSNSLSRHKVDYSITNDIISRHHPRILFFYTNECGICKEFEPDLTKTLSLYGNFFDCQYVNANDPSNHKLDMEFHLGGVPATFIFDNQGNQVFNQTGYIEHKTLSNILKTLYLEEYKEYETQKNQQPKSAANEHSADTLNKASKKTKNQKL